MGDYKLSASLQGHEDDVRGVVFTSSDSLVSVSRDATVREWRRDPKTAAFDGTIAHHGTEFINSCAFLGPSPDHPQGLILSGGKDTIIDVRPPGRPPEADAERLLIGHQGNVCSLDAATLAGSGLVVSGSWDASAMVWDVDKGEPSHVLEGHEGSVWAVLILDGKTVVTACADKKIRIFTTAGKLVRQFKGGDDVVRALCRLPEGTNGGAHFASAGNDALIRTWTLEGVQVAELRGHESFIYSLAALPDGGLVSSSEDRTLRVWRGAECVQTITHPAISVWAVGVCTASGDVATGASDKVVRIFSRDASRQADAAAIQAFEDSVRASSIPKQAMPDVDKDELPGPEFLQQRSGTKEGQVQMVREANGVVSAHQWSSAARAWVNIGTVVDSAGSSGRRTQYLGQDYDYVFDVDIEEGKPPLKLPFNLSQNPYDVAAKFIADHELPATYLDQVTEFIITNTQGASIGQSGGAGGAGGGQEAPDPWGTGDRYRPDEQRPASPPPRPKVIPQKNYLFITTANFNAMFKKIGEVNAQLLKDGQKGLTLVPAQLELLPALAAELDEVLTQGGDAPAPRTSPALDAGVDVAVHIITQWPPEHRIPGLDLWRCVCAATPAAVTRHDFLGVVDASAALSVLTGADNAASANSTMLMLRALVNTFAHADGRALVASRWSNFWGVVAPYLAPPSQPGALVAERHVASLGHNANRNVLIACATFCIDAAILLIMACINTDDPTFERERGSGELEARAQAVCEALVRFVADAKVTDSEVAYRSLIAVGSLLYERRLDALGRKKPQSRFGAEDVRKMLAKVQKQLREPRFRNVLDEIDALL